LEANRSKDDGLPSTIARFCRHLDSLESKIQVQVSRDRSVFPSVRKRFARISSNYLYGLEFLRYIAAEVMMTRVNDLLKDVRKIDSGATQDDIVRDVFNEHIRRLHMTAE
jgi:uncharacterized membrane protein